MKLPQFLHILANQCARFAPDVEISDALDGALTQLRSYDSLASADEELVTRLVAAVAPVYAQAFAEIVQAMDAPVRERLAELEAARAQAEAEALERRRVETEAAAADAARLAQLAADERATERASLKQEIKEELLAELRAEGA